MTFLEKAMEMNIKMTESEIVDCYCPKDLELERAEDEPVCYCGTVAEECRECWNREMPNTEPLTENERKIDFMSENAYNKGLNDAWELARTLYDKKCEELGKIFGIWDSFYEIIRNCTPQEALAKLKAYEEAQNKVVVGDVVKCKGFSHEYVVMATSEETLSKQPFLRCTEPPYQVSYGSDEDLIKTGKHINILEQIGE